MSVLGFCSKPDLLQQGVKKFYHAAQETFGIPNMKTIVQLCKIAWTGLEGFVYYFCLMISHLSIDWDFFDCEKVAPIFFKF